MASIQRPNDPASRAFRRFREHGDPAAMTEVFDLVGQELFALAAHIARDAAEAEDLVQEVFLAALAGARRFDPTRAVTPWLVGILVREARKARRGRAQREAPHTQRPGPRDLRDEADAGLQRTAPHAEAPLAKALTGEVRLAIRLALEAVPARYREVLQPVLEDGVAPTTLAATLGRAPGTVRTQLHRGLELLRKALPHTLAPALVPPLVSALAFELGAGRGLAAIRAELQRRATLDGPGLALAGAGVVLTPSLPLVGVVVMQTKVLAALAAAALVSVVYLAPRDGGAPAELERAPALAALTKTSLVAAPNARTPEPAPTVRSPVATTRQDSVPAAAGERAEATIAVETRADLELSGRVVDAVSGAPIAGVELRVQQQSELDGPSEQRPCPLPPGSVPDAVTDGAGWFRVPAKSWETSVALFTAAGWSPHVARLHQASAGGAADVASRSTTAEPTVLEIALLRAARIEGTVTGAPGPARVMVSIHEVGLISRRLMADGTFNLRGTDYLLTSTVDAAGAFTLENVPAEASLALSLVETATGDLLLQEAQPVQIAPGVTHRVSWALGSGGRFECSVHHAAGAPAPNEELWLLAVGPADRGETDGDWEPLQRTRTDATGRASFEDVQPGPWVVALAPAKQVGDSTLRYAVRATIDAPGAHVPVVFTLQTGLYISGMIVTQDGTPTRARLHASSGSFHAQPHEAGHSGGRFRVGPLLPGRYRLLAMPTGVTAAGATPMTDSEPVFAEAGTDGVELRLRAGCDFVMSAIEAATGDSLPAAFTVIPQERESMIFTRGHGGSATISGHPPGRYCVLAHSEDGLVGLVAVDVAAGERRAVTVPVSGGGSVRVRYRGPARALTVLLELPDTKVGHMQVPSGSSEALFAPAGTYTLRLAVRELDHATQQMKALREETRKVEVASGRETVVEVEQ